MASERNSHLNPHSEATSILVSQALAQAISSPSALPSTPPIESDEWPRWRHQSQLEPTVSSHVTTSPKIVRPLPSQDSGCSFTSTLDITATMVTHGFDSNDSILDTSDDEYHLEMDMTSLATNPSSALPSRLPTCSTKPASAFRPSSSHEVSLTHKRTRHRRERRSVPDDSDESDVDVDRRPPSSRRRKSSSDSSSDERHADSAPPLSGSLLRPVPVQPAGSVYQVPIPTMTVPSQPQALAMTSNPSKLHWSTAELKSFRNSCLQEARAAGFDRRSWRNPHWIYVRWLLSNTETMSNTLRNQGSNQDGCPLQRRRRLRRLPSAPTVSPLRTSVVANTTLESEDARQDNQTTRRRSVSLVETNVETTTRDIPPSCSPSPPRKQKMAMTLKFLASDAPSKYPTQPTSEPRHDVMVSPATSSAPSVASSLDSRDQAPTTLVATMQTGSVNHVEVSSLLPSSPPLNVAQALLQRHRRTSRPALLVSGRSSPPSRRRKVWFGPDVYRRDLDKIEKGLQAALLLGSRHPFYRALNAKAAIVTQQLERCVLRAEQNSASHSRFETVSSSTSDLSQSAESPPLTEE
eukprot:m.142726 g.142726  ORF g.142726 m.142726 type:complete len:578 (-) comp16165_c0_seq1:2766-4499(-)